ncbi:GNAT family N-acetyltransferase [Virgibacillus sp. NKC19-16]|uniref:GNAT family N-acetyltransferase n=1 Tax=Virgibacillus salidurans TaxID=2831673 RepID=UPI001F1E6634|nr:GNAT family N-acetyltransferase [Virgibacillus sp. NKC19-16]UJL47494.1 GNAT family N-acetyltransferase [Virgibacillus sp. NKC19-16]
MIYESDLNVRKKLFPMFDGMNDTIILSCLQGHMGSAWVDDLESPTACQISLGDFVFYAGNPHAKEAEALLNNLPENILAIVNTNEWKKRIETIHEGSIKKIQRYSFKKNVEDLDRNHIGKFLSGLPEGHELKRIDASLAKEASLHEISKDFTGQFDSIDDYLNRGLGYAVVYDGKVACGASSYSIYDTGIEIEIGTHPNHRRKGLATVAAAALILECLDRGLYPSWDAANLESAELAQKLGYVLDGAYDTYYITYKRF